MSLFPFLITIALFILIYIFSLPIIRYQRRAVNEYRFREELLQKELHSFKDTPFVIMSVPRKIKGTKND